MSGWSVEGLRVDVGGFGLGPVTLSLGPRETVAVLGESGAGKTTLLRAIAGLLPLSGGRVRRGTEEVSTVPVEARGTAYVPQGLALFPDRSVARNVAYPVEHGRSPPDPAIVPALLARFGLERLAHRRPETLSTGEQQRVALARALASRPELLLWDEPLGALDVLSRDDLLTSLRELRAASETPLLFVTHDPTLAFSLADRWLILDRGRPMYLGPPGPLIENPPSRFVARFVGFDNVLARAEVDGLPLGPLHAALEAGAGPDGVALTAPRARPFGAGRPAGFAATVLQAAPTPEGPALTAAVEGLRLRLRWSAPPGTPLPRAGDTVDFDLVESACVPVGRGPEGAWVEAP